MIEKKRRLDFEFIDRALKLYPSRQANEEITFSFDSRKTKPGQVFVAVVGEKLDGHDYLVQALENGASGVLVSDAHKLSRALETTQKQSIPSWVVPDTVEALRTIATVLRREFSGPVISIIGNVGKTTTKERIRALLRGRFQNIVATEGSENGYLGIPMTLLKINSLTEAAVIEIGIDECGAMEKHIQLVNPNYTVLTSLGAEHLEKLVDISTANKEEWIGVSHTLKNGGTALVPIHNDYVSSFVALERDTSRLYGFTIHPHSPQTSNSDKHLKLFKLNSGKIFTPDGGVFEAAQPELDSEPLWASILAASSLGSVLQFSPIEIQQGLSTYSAPPLRSAFLKSTYRDCEVLLDAYNANPDSMEAAFRTFYSLAERDQRASQKSYHLVLGDMLELGQDELAFHEKLAPSILKLNFSGTTYLFGPRMKALFQKLSLAGVTVKHFEDISLLIESLKMTLRPQDRILIKGSRGMKLERVWEALK